MKRKAPDFGEIFGESIEGFDKNKKLPHEGAIKNSQSWDHSSFVEEKESISSWRLVPVYVILAIFLILLFGRAFKLQVIDGETFMNKSQGNHVLIVANYAPRGVIYDRNGKVLARNKPGYRVSLRKVDLPKDWEKQAREVAPLISEKPNDLVDKIKKTKTDSVTLETDLTNDQIISLKTQEDKYNWLSIEIYPKREYPYGESIAPLLGYTGEASEGDLKKKEAVPYVVGDQVGRTGAEDSFEHLLRGANGYQLIKVDSQGKKQGVIFETQPVSGNDITLSIDADLQKYVYDQMTQTLNTKGGEGGSAVVEDPKTGEILAMVSAPSFDNNLFSNKLSQASYDEIINNPGHPLLNRAISTAYPPGSTFKMIIGTAGLETGLITKDTKITDTGFIEVGGTTFNNWLWLDHHQTDGDIDVIRALARSNDIFFYRLGENLGVDRISSYANKFGFGQPTGVELPGEINGLVPTKEWKIKNFGETWYQGDTINYGIGQGYLSVTPMQLAVATASFANGGKLVQPTIVHKNKPKILNDKVISPESLSTIAEGLYQDTVGDGNVSYLFKNYKIKSAGKTGSAQVGADFKPDAWYTAFAPFDDPKLSVTVLVEQGGHGADLSAPLTRNIFNWYFH
ncbi:MAG TPA: penicillin-binding protein 2 [Candidatus Saccharimonadales bacterium]|nr:penicillin-binding protein 2 [Candidatus Saccharimonadales bacterium]